jgi:Sec-independent protein translocase protein TatA
MFGIGIWEFVGIVVALVVFLRPEDVPKALNKLGRLYGKLTRMSREWTGEVKRGMQSEDESPAKRPDETPPFPRIPREDRESSMEKQE